MSDFIDHDSNSWNLSSVSNLLPPAALNAILATSFGSSADSDRLIWFPSGSGIYSVKSGYKTAVSNLATSHSINQNQSTSISPLVWKWIWKIRVPPRIKHFLWKMASNAVATNLARFKRHLSPTPLCLICEEHEESIEHVIFLCPWALKTWFAHPFSYKKIDTQAFTSFHLWFLAYCDSLDSDHGSLNMNFLTHIGFLI